MKHPTTLFVTLLVLLSVVGFWYWQRSVRPPFVNPAPAVFTQTQSPTAAENQPAADSTAGETASPENQTSTAAPALSYPIVDTAQDSCYGNTSAIACPESAGAPFFGQDAQYEDSAPRYRDNGDDTVSDLVTGLMWVKDAGAKRTYADAVAGAASFSLAGHSDWRVPSIKELYSLMDFRGVDPSSMDASPADLTPFLDTKYFDFQYGDTSTGSRVIDSQWVTSTTYVSTVMNGQHCFFGVNFADGRIKCYPTTNNNPNNKGYFVRYVRGPVYGANSFTDNGDGTIRDAATGLVWQQKDSGKGIFWEDALSYCENLTLAGNSDWRLPNAKELQSIVDYTRSPDTTDSPALSPLFKSTYIFNEAGKKDWPYYWTSTTHLTQVDGQSAVYVSFGRALGYMQEFGGWIDVHGAGAQRSDMKTGDPADYPTGFGPQGDARRFYNYARCVRGGVTFTMDTAAPSQSAAPAPAPSSTGQGTTPPQEAIDACVGHAIGAVCSFSPGPQGVVTGTCQTPPGSALACVPAPR